MYQSHAQLKIIREIVDERIRQDAKWGEQNHDNYKWLAILGEEYGEACNAVLESDPAPIIETSKGIEDLRAELIQVAASAIAWLEAMERQP